jgi:hypothetical protein
MQDFSTPFVSSAYETAITRRLSKEQLISSPADMYLYSLALKDRLPDELHNAMLVWSFDPEEKAHVQAYLSWVASCDERKRARKDWERKMERSDTIMNVTMIIALLGVAIQIIVSFLY